MKKTFQCKYCGNTFWVEIDGSGNVYRWFSKNIRTCSDCEKSILKILERGVISPS